MTVGLASDHARAMRKLSVEHVHAHFANHPALGAWTVARLAGPTYSFTAHAHDIFRDQSFLRRLIADARFVVTISQFNREFLARYNAAGTPVHVVHCGRIDPAGGVTTARRASWLMAHLRMQGNSASADTRSSVARSEAGRTQGTRMPASPAIA